MSEENTQVAAQEDAPKSNREIAEETYEWFFSNEAEAAEQKKQILEIAKRKDVNIQDNDAIWIIIYVLNYFGRFYHDLPEKLRGAAKEASEAEVRKAQLLFAEALKESTEKILEQHKRRSWLQELFMPMACICLGVFVLCLISFVGGAAVVGKGWGTGAMPALLNAPAGWIIPLAMIPMASVAVYRGMMEEGRSRYVNFSIVGTTTLLALLVLMYVL